MEQSRAKQSFSAAAVKLTRDKVVLGILTLVMVGVSSTLFALDTERDVAFVILGGAISALLALVIQVANARGTAEQLNRLNQIRTDLGGLGDTVAELRTSADEVTAEIEGIAIQLEKASSTLTDLQKIASSSRQDVLRLQLSGGGPVAGLNAPGSELQGLVLRSGRDLSGANLQASIWGGIEADRVVFSGARLEGAKLNGTMNESSFAGAFLQDAELTGNYGHCGFEQAILMNTRLRGYFRYAVFLEPAEFTGVLASKADMRDCRFGDTDYLQHSCFWAATLSDTQFSGTCIAGCDFRWTVLRDARIASTPRMAAGTTFEGAVLERTDFRDTPIRTLRSWDFRGAIDAGAQWPPDFDRAAAGLVAVDSPAGLDKLRQHLYLRDEQTGCPVHDPPKAAPPSGDKSTTV